MLSMIKWKYPDIGLTFACDHCDKRKESRSETGMKKCPCFHQFDHGNLQ